MVDYKELYHKMFNAAEDAINLLIAAQRECEERVISDGDGPLEENLTVLPQPEDKE